MNSPPNTAEQFIAMISGLLTSGPLGCLAALYVLRRLEGKWFPWCIAGVIFAPFLIGAQLYAISRLHEVLPSPTPTPTQIEIYR